MDEIESKQEMRMDLDLEIELEEPNECIFNLRFQLKNVCNKHYKKKGKILFLVPKLCQKFLFHP